MVALFVVLMIAAVLVVDLILHARHQPALADKLQARLDAGAARRLPKVAGFRIAPEAAYHPGHAWARHTGSGQARLGLDDFAARLLGKATRIEAPAVGTHVRAGHPMLTVEHKGRRTRIVAPVSGVVAAVNKDALADPGLLLEDPYEKGWLVEVRNAELSYDMRALLTGEMARRLVDEAAAALHTYFGPAEMVPAAADGGEPLAGIADMLDDETWDRVRSRFLLTDPA